MQVNPQEKIQLVYVIIDPSDSGTHYVQTVMRNSADGSILGTMQLTVDANNSRRFTGSISAPSYNGPGALYIDLTTTVYTSNAYTVKDTNYNEQVDKFVVAYRWSMSLGAGGSGGSGGFGNFDWEKLARVLLSRHKKIVSEVKEMIPAPAEPIDIEALKTELMSGTIEGMKTFHSEREAKLKSIKRNREKRAKKEENMKRLAKAVSELPPPEEPKGAKPFVEEKEVEERDLDTGLRARTVTGTRKPSEGVVPFLLVHRNLMYKGKKKRKTTV